MLLLQKNSIQRAFMACRMLSNDDSMRFSGQGSSMMRVFAWFDGDLEAQDLGGLAEVLFVDDADDLAGDVAGWRAMLLLAVCPQLVQIVGGLREVIEVDAGAHTARPGFGMQLCCRFLREVHSELRRPIMSRLEVVQLHGQERIVGIDTADAFLAQRPFHMREVVDDAAEVLLEVIPRGRLRIDVRLRDVLHRERPCGRQMAKIVHPCEDLLDFCFFPENFLELFVEIDELPLIRSRQEVEVRAVENLLDFLEAQAQFLVVLDDVERRALQDIVDAVAIRRGDVHRLQESVLVVKAQCRQRRMVEFGHLADR